MVGRRMSDEPSGPSRSGQVRFGRRRVDAACVTAFVRHEPVAACRVVACGGLSGETSGCVDDDAGCRDRRRAAGWATCCLKKQKVRPKAAGNDY